MYFNMLSFFLLQDLSSSDFEKYSKLKKISSFGDIVHQVHLLFSTYLFLTYLASSLV